MVRFAVSVFCRDRPGIVGAGSVVLAGHGLHLEELLTILADTSP